MCISIKMLLVFRGPVFMSAGRLSHSKSSLQLMVTGLTGRTGAIVLSRVAAECRIDQERAPIPRRLYETRACNEDPCPSNFGSHNTD